MRRTPIFHRITLLLALTISACARDPYLDPGKPDWVLGAWHIVEELPGYYAAVAIDQFEFTPDGRVEFYEGLCGLESRAQAQWIGDGHSVDVIPLDGEASFVVFGRAATSMHVEPLADDPTTIDFEFTLAEFPDFVDGGQMSFGKMCLSCSGDGSSNAYVCG